MMYGFVNGKAVRGFAVNRGTLSGLFGRAIEPVEGEHFQITFEDHVIIDHSNVNLFDVRQDPQLLKDGYWPMRVNVVNPFSYQFLFSVTLARHAQTGFVVPVTTYAAWVYGGIGNPALKSRLCFCYFKAVSAATEKECLYDVVFLNYKENKIETFRIKVTKIK